MRVIQKIRNASLIVKIIGVYVLGLIGFGLYKVLGLKQSTQTQYQTKVVQRGTLVVAVSASGTVASTNSSNVSTNATGVVSQALVKDGAQVKMGQKITTVELNQSD